MTLTTVRDELMPLALGHDQTASHCAWVQLTRSTTDYPSRRAQAAMALLAGAIAPSEALVDVMFRCDGCYRCVPGQTAGARAFSELLFDARAKLVDDGLVPEAEQWTANWQKYGNVHGNISASLSGHEPGGPAKSVVFVPGAALLSLDPSAAQAAWRLVQRTEPDAVFDAGLTDSGFVLRELGLVDFYEAERNRVRDHIASRDYKTVIAGTPKVALELSSVFAELPVTVVSVLDLLMDRLLPHAAAASLDRTRCTFLLHPSDSLIGQKDRLGRTQRGLSMWLGDAYRPEVRDVTERWPAALERISTAGNGSLERRFAERRAAQLVEHPFSRGVTILTVDPFSREALNTAIGDRAEVIDLVSCALRTLEGAGTDG